MSQSGRRKPRKPRRKLTRIAEIKRPPRVRVEKLEPATWRLVLDTVYDGATNMAIDEAIGESVARGDSLPTLRLYQWSPACLSLGRTQSADVVDVERCERHGWDVIRRSTGGRAVLHVDELTYSIAAQEDEPRVNGGVMESYRRLSAGLLKGLKGIGLEPERAQSWYGDEGDKGAACFDGPAEYEITVGQRKLIGSAQMRSRNLVLQHGAIPLTGDITRIIDGLQLNSGERLASKTRLHYRATNLEIALGRAVEPAELAQFLVKGFANALNIQFEEQALTAAERERAQQIRAEKYANDAWTYRL